MPCSLAYRSGTKTGHALGCILPDQKVVGIALAHQSLDLIIMFISSMQLELRKIS